MIKERNWFVITDSDCMQYEKDLGNRKFLFIHAIWMNAENGSEIDYTEIHWYRWKSIL